MKTSPSVGLDECINMSTETPGVRMYSVRLNANENYYYF